MPHTLRRSGTGSVIATNACRLFYRTKWVEFPFLIRDLRQKAAKEGTALGSRLGYYCCFGLLCIGEFMSMDVEEEMSRNDVYLFQEFAASASYIGSPCLSSANATPASWTVPSSPRTPHSPSRAVFSGRLRSSPCQDLTSVSMIPQTRIVWGLDPD